MFHWARKGDGLLRPLSLPRVSASLRAAKITEGGNRQNRVLGIVDWFARTYLLPKEPKK